MSRYKAYLEYKDSGVTWMGRVPACWQPIRMKHVFFEKKKTSNPELDAGSISFGRVIYKNSENLAPETKAAYQEVLAGEFLVNPLNLNFDLLSLRTALSDIDVVVSTGYIVLNSDVAYDKKYLKWLLQQFDVSHMKTLGAGVRQTINYTDIACCYFLSPSYLEQQKIANFLDHETAKIDTLIAKQQELIKLLKEKRQAVISHAVTKGLNPNAPMRDSGVEWLGEVPAHWRLCKFNHCASIRNGQVDPSVLPYRNYTLIAPNHIESGTGRLIELETAEAQGADSGKYLCTSGEIIYSKIRPALAKVCVSPNDETICSADMYPIRAENGLTNEFLFFSLLSNWFTSFAILESDRVAMPKINREKLSEIKIAFPEVAEQLMICSEIRRKTSVIDELLGRTESSISYAYERRTALISAAVTGKIDVRDWQPPLSEAQAA
ncbi:restriction endonuclease subunit S [Undibacterium curvum]|uniref:Restriction endonuclease subunit S n=1 Tax=Undibacterium curvum TaxID=2762294 RepID=A0ABR7A101_9BURK|nr:restriction endonuclease subunit S [Undibacterium curvum]MBC3930580.1 restriction endonuclease subunit S [Undibacterium curvum]